MNIKKAMISAVSMLVFMLLVYVCVFVFVAGLFSAGHYNLEFFTMPISEWHGFFRIVLYLYGSLTAWLTITTSIDEL